MSADLADLADLADVAEAALELCAKDLDCARAEVEVRDRRDQYKSSVLLLGRAGSGVSHVAKLDPDGARSGRWDPERELAGLRCAAERIAGQPGLGAIVPVGGSPEPGFLVTRYVEGATGRPAFDRAVTWPWAGPDLREARRQIRLAARWLGAFRGPGEGRPDEGSSHDDYLATCRARAVELSVAVPRSRGTLERLLGLLERVLADLPEADAARLRLAFPTHGDMAPQNFHVGADGLFYVLDLEGFAVRALDNDVSRLRMRLEHYAIRGPLARRRAGQLWAEFVDAFDEIRKTPQFALLAHAHWLLAHLAWLKPGPGELRPAQPLGSRVRGDLWVRGRLRWLRDIPGLPAGASAYLRAQL